MKFKSILIVALGIGSAIVLTSCATGSKKSSEQAYAKGKSNYFAQQYNSSFQEIQQAAQAGDPDAEYALGYMYYYGKGTPQNIVQAKSWMRKAAAQGQQQAVKALELIGEKAPPQVAKVNIPPQSRGNGAQTFAANTTTHVNTNTGRAGNQTTAAIVPQPSTNVATNIRTGSGSVKPIQRATNVKIASPTSTVKATRQATGTNQTGYTLQLLGSRSKDDVIAFMQRNGLNKRAVYYKTTYRGGDWYVLVYGRFKTRANAKAAIQQLPAAVQAQQPWVKPLASVEASINFGRTRA